MTIPDRNATPSPAAGARLALGGVRAAARYPALPATGPDRLLALRQLRAVIRSDVGRAIAAAVDAGWHPLDHEQIVDGYARWLVGFLIEGIAEGTLAWREEQR